jgi:uncharacterized membrane protein YfcA
MFELIGFLASTLAGGVASVAGFGIGSILTPLLSLTFSTKLAIALVAIPHFLATLFRFWLIKSHLDFKLFLHFGLLSALGGTLGAYSQNYLATPSLNFIFGIVLLLTGGLGIFGLSEKLRFYGSLSWVAGGISGFFGGLVGNQGGIRAAAMLGQGISKEAFVATATAVGLVVDLARIPVYLNFEWERLVEFRGLISLISAGCLFGTLLGIRFLKYIPERVFKRAVSGLVLGLGIVMISRSFLMP